MLQVLPIQVSLNCGTERRNLLNRNCGLHFPGTAASQQSQEILTSSPTQLGPYAITCLDQTQASGKG